MFILLAIPNTILQIPIVRRPRPPVPIPVVDWLPLVGVILLHISLHAGMERHLHVALRVAVLLHTVLHHVRHHRSAVAHLGVELLLLLIEGHVEAHLLLLETHLRAHGKSHAHAWHHRHVWHVWHIRHIRHQRGCLAVFERFHLLDEGLFDVGGGILGLT